MNIIRRRIEKYLKLTWRTSEIRQKRKKSCRRMSYKKGVVRYTSHVTVPMTAELRDRTDSFCAALNVPRCLIIRDALEFYLSIAEGEFREELKAAQPERPKERSYYVQPTVALAPP